MTLIYTKTTPEPYVERFAASLDADVEFRTARLWRGETEKAQAVYADDERIRKAYEDKGIPAKPIALREPSKTIDPAPKRKPRKRTTKAKPD